MTETVRKWELRTSSAALSWREDVTSARELLYPKEVIRQIEEEPDPYKRQRILHDARHKL